MNKRKIVLLAVALMMVAILGFGGTLAYLTDTDRAVNTFTTGHVDITLDEAKVEKNENGDYVPVEGADRVKQQEYKVFPGNEIDKDPTIKLLEGSENAWIAAKVVITGEGVYDLFGVEGFDYINIKTTDKDGNPIFSGGLLDIDTVAQKYKGLNGYDSGKVFVYQEADKKNNTWTLYVYMTEPQGATMKAALFEKVSIPAEWDNDEMIKFNNTKIDITAYAVQADGFHNCVYAMSAAFGTNGITQQGIFPDTTDDNAD